MIKRSLALGLLAALGGALALTVAYLDTALQHAGPYRELPEVHVPVATALVFSYSLTLAVAGILLHRALQLARPWCRRLALGAWVLGMSALIFLAPALPYLILALLCKAQPLCPEAANPIAWALTGLAASREKPFGSTWAVLAVALVLVLWRRRHPTGCT